MTNIPTGVIIQRRVFSEYERIKYKCWRDTSGKTYHLAHCKTNTDEHYPDAADGTVADTINTNNTDYAGAAVGFNRVYRSNTGPGDNCFCDNNNIIKADDGQ